MTLDTFVYVCSFVVLPLAIIQLIVTVNMLQRERRRAKNKQIILDYLRRNGKN